MKGGGDAVSAARAVLQTGEYDYAWNLQVEDDVLTRLERAGKGRVVVAESTGIEHIQCNQTDPNVEVDGERSSIKTKHPSLGDPAVREALNYLLDRDSVQRFIYGRTGQATANFVNTPKRFRSPNMHYGFNIQKATELLDQAGWKPGPDGIRAKDGVRLKYLFQTSINQPRQKTQQVFKQACQKAGIELELKSVTASVYFSSDLANPDTYSKFYADLQMYNTTSDTPDPALFLRNFLSAEVAQKANKWQGRNIVRWQNQEYDDTWAKQQSELDPINRAQILIECNDLVCKSHVILPLVYRPIVRAMVNAMHAVPSGFDSDFWALSDWWKDV
jgi:peptide/nickel transport system substrate-binding protein